MVWASHSLRHTAVLASMGAFQMGKWIPHPLPWLQYDDQQPIMTCTPIPAEFDSRLLRSRLKQRLERVSNYPRPSAPFS